MFRCPYCNEKGIGVWAKYWSTARSPVVCSKCGQSSFVKARYRYGFQTAWPLVVTWVLVAITLYFYLTSNELHLLFVVPILWMSGKIIELSMLPMSQSNDADS